MSPFFQSGAGPSHDSDTSDSEDDGDAISVTTVAPGAQQEPAATSGPQSNTSSDTAVGVGGGLNLFQKAGEEC